MHLKVEDVWDGKQAKDFLYVVDEIDGETQAFYLNKQVKDAIQTYLQSIVYKPSDYLFKSKKNDLPITRQQAYRIINHVAKEAGVEGNIGTHTLRKTFGYHAYKKGVAISIIMSIFKHHSSTETLKYIGIDKNEENIIQVDVNL